MQRSIRRSSLRMTLAARRTRSAQLPVPEGNEPWQVSMRHFAAAIDYRFAGIENKLVEHDARLGIPQPPPPAPVDRTFNPQPSDGNTVSMSGVPVGATDPPPPRPAATSLRPDDSE